MTNLRKAAEIKTWQQRCEEHPDHEGIVTEQMIRDRMQEEIDELRQALAQPDQEPVAWMTHTNDLQPLFHKTMASALNWQTQPTPLYTAPPKQPEQEPVAWADKVGAVIPHSHKLFQPDLLKDYTRPLYTAPPSLEVAVLAERKRIVNLFMIQHEAAKGAHNYWQVAANLVQADVASDT